MEKNILEKLEKSHSLADIFELVKDCVDSLYKKHRRGLMLGLADLGGGANAWIGGYHIISSNAIIMNSRPLDYVKKHHPELHKPYVFVILTHEYIHTLGVLDEKTCRELTYKLCHSLLKDEITTAMAKDMSKFLPKIQQASFGWQPSQDPHIYYVRDFDRSSVTYVI
ncbi:hypothetical protein DSAG12_01405 [Promethearchaeum syntrophicum]|uniref:Uncharacterized protein n=1 Tax=Promethearchaeum syntrophicum TaxID=2594042 RepID=A0A5B9D8V7_9ARCH|nr:hypothetical protein [Candidatus Prometheoarchaeum syntrophicum]QEE15579.1 hypothetical protein DSAG12_01405 [Candidatus Prometheoarchaeum syntrophicum]